jgi:hypothetical protein
MTDYTAVDAVLMPWAAKHELHVYARDRSTTDHLRSIIAYYWRGTRHESAGHMWIDGPDRDGRYTVHGAAPDWHKEITAPVGELEQALEEMFQTMTARPVWD